MSRKRAGWAGGTGNTRATGHWAPARVVPVCQGKGSQADFKGTSNRSLKAPAGPFSYSESPGCRLLTGRETLKHRSLLITNGSPAKQPDRPNKQGIMSLSPAHHTPMQTGHRIRGCDGPGPSTHSHHEGHTGLKGAWGRPQRHREQEEERETGRASHRRCRGADLESKV